MTDRSRIIEKAAHIEGATPVEEWRKVVDEPVWIFVVHPNAEFCQNDPEELARWQGWHEAHWTDFNGGGFVWHGLLGRITHVRARAVLDKAKEG